MTEDERRKAATDWVTFNAALLSHGIEPRDMTPGRELAVLVAQIALGVLLLCALVAVIA